MTVSRRPPTLGRPPRALGASRLVALLLAPVLLPQARRLRRAVPRLPDATLPWEGVSAPPSGVDAGGTRAPRRVLVIGDSTAAGVGVERAADGLAGALGAELAARTGRAVAWRAVGENGATARDLLRRYVPVFDVASAPAADLVMLSVGANDALGVRGVRGFRRDIRGLLHRLAAAHPDAVLLMSSLPAFQRFELLPQPLRSALARHALALERGARREIAASPRWRMSPPPPPYGDDFFAVDRFHPGAAGYRDWARFALDDAEASGLDLRSTGSTRTARAAGPVG